MKRTVTLTAAIVIAAGLVTFAPTSAPAAEATPIANVLAIPHADRYNQGCEAVGAARFRYISGGVRLDGVGPDIVATVTNSAGVGVEAGSLPVGFYLAVFVARPGYEFRADSGIRLTVIQNPFSVQASAPCGKPGTKVHRGAWRVVRHTAHTVTLRRTVKTTRYHSVLASDLLGGKWVPRTSVKRETVKRAR